MIEIEISETLVIDGEDTGIEVVDIDGEDFVKLEEIGDLPEGIGYEIDGKTSISLLVINHSG
ncbi:MAG: hypothetical protein R2883_03595 [Caldisericia bacterium]